MNTNANWESIHQSRHWGIWPSEYMVRQAKAFTAWYDDQMKHVPFPVRPTSLDIGCGVGSHSWMMQREGMIVTAIDVAPTAIARLPMVAPEVDASVMDVMNAQYPPESFDFILDNLSLTHVEKPPIDRIISWLKPGGWFVSAVFQPGPEDAPPSWPHQFGPIVEAYGVVRGVRYNHGIQVQRWVKP